MRGTPNPFPSGFYGFEEYVPAQKFHEIDSSEFAKIYKHEEVEGEKSPVPVWCAPRPTFHTGLNFLHAVPLPVPASEIFWLTLMAIN